MKLKIFSTNFCVSSEEQVLVEAYRRATAKECKVIGTILDEYKKGGPPRTTEKLLEAEVTEVVLSGAGAVIEVAETPAPRQTDTEDRCGKCRRRMKHEL